MGFLKNLVNAAKEADAKQKAEQAKQKAERDAMFGNMGKVGKVLKFIDDHTEDDKEDQNADIISVPAVLVFGG